MKLALKSKSMSTLPETNIRESTGGELSACNEPSAQKMQLGHKVIFRGLSKLDSLDLVLATALLFILILTIFGVLLNLPARQMLVSSPSCELPSCEWEVIQSQH